MAKRSGARPRTASGIRGPGGGGGGDAAVGVELEHSAEAESDVSRFPPRFDWISPRKAPTPIFEHSAEAETH